MLKKYEITLTVCLRKQIEKHSRAVSGVTHGDSLFLGPIWSFPAQITSARVRQGEINAARIPFRIHSESFYISKMNDVI